MDIAQLSTALSTQNLAINVGAALLSKSLDTVENAGDAMIKMMEQSVTPNIGGSIDIKI